MILRYFILEINIKYIIFYLIYVLLIFIIYLFFLIFVFFFKMKYQAIYHSIFGRKLLVVIIFAIKLNHDMIIYIS